MMSGAGEKNRTPNLLITSQLLYQLSYASILYYLPYDKVNYTIQRSVCQCFFGGGAGIRTPDTAGMNRML